MKIKHSSHLKNFERSSGFQKWGTWVCFGQPIQDIISIYQSVDVFLVLIFLLACFSGFGIGGGNKMGHFVGEAFSWGPHRPHAPDIRKWPINDYIPKELTLFSKKPSQCGNWSKAYSDINDSAPSLVFSLELYFTVWLSPVKTSYVIA